MKFDFNYNCNLESKPYERVKVRGNVLAGNSSIPLFHLS